MLKQTDNLRQVVSEQYANDHFNVFYSEGALIKSVKKGEELFFLYSDKYVIPVTISKKGIFRYAHLTIEPAAIKDDAEETLKSFLDDVCSYLKNQLKVQWIDQTSPASFFMDYPTGAKRIPFGSHVIDLTLDEETLWKKVHTKHRNVIKKAEKDGVEIKCGISDQLIVDYHSIDVETWRRSNKSATGQESLRNQVRALGDDAIIYMAYLNGKPQSGAFFFYNRGMCYYMHGANCDRPHTGAGNLLQWKAILDMKEIGVKKYSFVGCRINEDENSKYHGIQRFKERFGGELVQGYMFKVIFSPFHYQAYRMLGMVKRFLLTGKMTLYKDIIDQEIHKWK